jgi:hypothetical protein
VDLLECGVEGVGLPVADADQDAYWVRVEWGREDEVAELLACEALLQAEAQYCRGGGGLDPEVLGVLEANAWQEH